MDGPMKLLFPNNRATGYPFAILGLGDIVVPALTTSLCLRADKELQLQGVCTLESMGFTWKCHIW